MQVAPKIWEALEVDTATAPPPLPPSQTARPWFQYVYTVACRKHDFPPFDMSLTN